MTGPVGNPDTYPASPLFQISILWACPCQLRVWLTLLWTCSWSISRRWKTTFKRVKSETSEIFVKESPAEPGDEVHSEGGEEHFKVCYRMNCVDIEHHHDHQSPHTQRNEARGETEAFEI